MTSLVFLSLVATLTSVCHILRVTVCFQICGRNISSISVKVFCKNFLTSKRYTSSSGERRIRVHTAAAPVVADLGDMYRQADTGAIISLLGRLGK